MVLCWVLRLFKIASQIVCNWDSIQSGLQFELKRSAIRTGIPSNIILIGTQLEASLASVKAAKPAKSNQIKMLYKSEIKVSLRHNVLPSRFAKTRLQPLIPDRFPCLTVSIN